MMRASGLVNILIDDGTKRTEFVLDRPIED
jgi:hypothetical protein